MSTATKIAWDRVGLVIRWAYISPGDSTRCERCFSLARKRGYVTEYGDPVVPS